MVILCNLTNFTFTYKVSYTSNIFKSEGRKIIPEVLPQSFYIDSSNILYGLLHLVMRSKTCTIRITAAAGTNLACASSFHFHYNWKKLRLYNKKKLTFFIHGDLLGHTCVYCPIFFTAAVLRSGTFSSPL